MRGGVTSLHLLPLPHCSQMVVHIEFEAVYVDGKRFVHARQVFLSELYKTISYKLLAVNFAQQP